MERRRERQLFYQLTRVTYEKGCLAHDDRLDALAMGVAFLAPMLNQNALEEQRTREREELEKEYRRFEEHLSGFSGDEDSWINTDLTGYRSDLL